MITACVLCLWTNKLHHKSITCHFYPKNQAETPFLNFPPMFYSMFTAFADHRVKKHCMAEVYTVLLHGIQSTNNYNTENVLYP